MENLGRDLIIGMTILGCIGAAITLGIGLLVGKVWL